MTEPTARMSRMMGKNFGAATYRYNQWDADLDEEQTIEDALNPRFWVDQAAVMMGHDKTNPKGRGDLIHLRKMDTGLYAKLLVTEIGAGYIKVIVVEGAQPKEPALPASSPLTTKWNAGRKVHEVIRDADKVVLSTGFQTKQAAIDWITDHTAKMAA